MNTARKVLRKTADNFYRQASLADPARAGDREQAHVRPHQEFSGGGGFLFSTHENGARNGESSRSGLDLLGRFFAEGVADRGQLTGQVTSGNVAPVRVLGETAFNDPA